MPDGMVLGCSVSVKVCAAAPAPQSATNAAKTNPQPRMAVFRQLAWIQSKMAMNAALIGNRSRVAAKLEFYG